MWLAGTAIGGCLGLLVMAFEPLATNPYGLMVILVTVAFCVGLLGQTQVDARAWLEAVCAALLAANVQRMGAECIAGMLLRCRHASPSH